MSLQGPLRRQDLLGSQPAPHLWPEAGGGGLSAILAGSTGDNPTAPLRCPEQPGFFPGI